MFFNFFFSTESFTNSNESLFVTTFSHDTIGEVSMHTCTIPVTFHWFRMEDDFIVVFFSNSMSKVSSNPKLVTCVFSSFTKYLVFPLSFHDFRINSFNSKSSINTSIKMFFNHFSSDSPSSSDTAVIRALRWRIVFWTWET